MSHSARVLARWLVIVFFLQAFPLPALAAPTSAQPVRLGSGPNPPPIDPHPYTPPTYPAQPSLRLSVLVAPDPLVPGATATITVTVDNLATDAALDTQVVLPLPKGMVELPGSRSAVPLSVPSVQGQEQPSEIPEHMPDQRTLTEPTFVPSTPTEGESVPAVPDPAVRFEEPPASVHATLPDPATLPHPDQINAAAQQASSPSQATSGPGARPAAADDPQWAIGTLDGLQSVVLHYR